MPSLHILVAGSTSRLRIKPSTLEAVILLRSRHSRCLPDSHSSILQIVIKPFLQDLQVSKPQHAAHTAPHSCTLCLLVLVNVAAAVPVDTVADAASDLLRVINSPCGCILTHSNCTVVNLNDANEREMWYGPRLSI